MPKLSLLTLLGFLPLSALAQSYSDDAVIYDNSLHSGWSPGGSATVNIAATAPVYGGSGNAISVTLGANQAVQFSRTDLATRLHDRLSFRINAGVSGGQRLRVRVMRSDGVTLPPYYFTPAPGGRWQQFNIPLASLGVVEGDKIKRIRIENGSSPSVAQTPFTLDDIRLLAKAVPASVNVAITPSVTLGNVLDREIGLNSRATDQLATDPVSDDQLIALRPSMLRWPGGTFGNDFDWSSAVQYSTGRNYRDRVTAALFADRVTRTAADTIFVANYGTGTPEMAAAWVAWANGDPADTRVIGVDETGRDWLTVGHWASLRAATPLATDDGFNHLRAGHAASYGRKRWEIGNENYGTWSPDAHGVTTSGITLAGVAHDPVTYAETFKRFNDAMKAVDPAILLGAVVIDGEDNYPSATHSVTNPRTGVTHSGWTPVMLSRLAALGMLPDFVQHHHYAVPGGSECDSLLLADFDGTKHEGDDIRTQLIDYLGLAGTTLEMNLTEHNAATNPGKQSVALTNALYLADANADLITSEFENRLWFQFHNGELPANNNDALLYGWRQYGSLGLAAQGGLAGGPASNTPFPTYHAFVLFGDWTAGGGQLLGVASGSPFLSVHALRRTGGGLSLLIVNKSVTRDITANITIPGLAPATASRFTYGKPQDLAETGPVQTSLATDADGFSATFPAYSITRIELP